MGIAAGIEPESEEPVEEEPAEEEPAAAAEAEAQAEPGAAAAGEPAPGAAVPEEETPAATSGAGAGAREDRLPGRRGAARRRRGQDVLPRPAERARGLRCAAEHRRPDRGDDAVPWGVTAPDPLRVRTRVCDDGPNWRLRVTGVTSVIRTFSRQLPGQQEPTTGRATAANFCTIVTDLDALGTCNPGAPAGSNFYMLAAVRAHEAVHVDEWRTSMGTDWPAQKAIIEGLNVPRAAPTASRRAASAAMRGSAAFQAAIQTGTANYPAFWASPTRT